MESILTSIKKLLGIEEEYTHFDPEIIMHINSVFIDLKQLGVGPSEGFAITDATDSWSDFTDDEVNYQAVKTYIYMKVKLIFDPPTSSAVIEAFNKRIAEIEFRLNVEAETPESV